MSAEASPSTFFLCPSSRSASTSAVPPAPEPWVPTPASLASSLQVKPPVIRIKPYVQASGGWVGTRAFNSGGSGTFNNNYAAYEILGGVDYPLVRFIDFRVIEVGGGQGYDIGAGRVSTAPNLSLFNINSGLVLHF